MSKDRSESEMPGTGVESARTISALPSIQVLSDRVTRLEEQLKQQQQGLAGIQSSREKEQDARLDSQKMRIRAICTVTVGITLTAVTALMALLAHLLELGLRDFILRSL